MVSIGNHPQMAEPFRLVNFIFNLPIYIYIYPFVTSSAPLRIFRFPGLSIASLWSSSCRPRSDCFGNSCAPNSMSQGSTWKIAGKGGKMARTYKAMDQYLFSYHFEWDEHP